MPKGKFSTEIVTSFTDGYKKKGVALIACSKRGWDIYFELRAASGYAICNLPLGYFPEKHRENYVTLVVISQPNSPISVD
jgi:hypothetical protein